MVDGLSANDVLAGLDAYLPASLNAALLPRSSFRASRGDGNGEPARPW